MGNPAFATVTFSVIAALVVFAPHALIVKAASRRRPGVFSRLIETLFGKLFLVIYASLGLAVLMALAGWAVLADTLTLPPKEPWSPEKAFAKLLDREGPAGASRNGSAGVLASIHHDAELLQGLAQTHPVPSAYLLQISVDAWQVARARKERSSADQLLAFAAQDLRAKSLYASKHPMDPFASIPVKVTTRNEQGQEVQNREVRFCLKGLMHYKQRHDSFERWSSPTSKPLPPGHYILWARRPDYMLWADRRRVTGPQTEYNIGAEGESERAVDLVAR